MDLSPPGVPPATSVPFEKPLAGLGGVEGAAPPCDSSENCGCRPRLAGVVAEGTGMGMAAGGGRGAPGGRYIEVGREMGSRLLPASAAELEELEEGDGGATSEDASLSSSSTTPLPPPSASPPFSSPPCLPPPSLSFFFSASTTAGGTKEATRARVRKMRRDQSRSCGPPALSMYRPWNSRSTPSMRADSCVHSADMWRAVSASWAGQVARVSSSCAPQCWAAERPTATPMDS
mmetsp:Transcript_32871/g.83411  ORF Transcript_32871/g.83411 Transcript_32871/m.83411 type:complete len:233 (-) Transcript_32871:312-1010(-)